jgi:anti-sigma B factor antagonist
VRFQDDVAVMSLSGKFLAGSDGPFLRQKVKDLLDAGTRKLVLDFAEVPYIDSTGLGFLAGARVSAQNAGASIVLAGVNPHVLKVLENVRLAEFFTIARDLPDAIKKVNKAAAQAASASETRTPHHRKQPAAPAE